MIGSRSGALVLGGFLVLVGAVLPGHPSLLAQAPDPGGMSRPDSVRALVLERIRDQLATDAEVDLDSASVEIGQDQPVEQSGTPARSSLEVPTELPAGADSIMQALIRLDGFNSASYQGIRADFDAGTRRLVLWGTEESRALFSGQGVRLEADNSITYEEVQGRVRTRGRSDFTPSTGDPLQSDVLIYDLVEGRGTAIGAETTYTQGAQWIVRGDLDSVAEDLLFGSSARFTTCDLPDPHSYFQANELKVIGGQVLVARSVRMYVDDVPIFWLPFMAQNLGSGRASGILTPTFSVNDIVRTSSGYNRRLSNLGYYWAMSEYSDMSVALDWYANNYLALQGGLRYRWARRFLNGSLNLKRYWRDTGRKELGLDTNHRWEISQRTSVRASGRYITSSSFVRENSFDPREMVATVDSDANLNRRFDWGQLTVGSSRKQYLNEERTETTLPSASLSLSTLTFFGAPTESARWYNNLSVNGSMSWDRRLAERELRPDSTFSFGFASEVRTNGSARGGMSLGDLSLRGSLTTRETVFQDVPGQFFLSGEEVDGLDPLRGMGDFRSGDVAWSAGLSFQQGLIGSTTLTPSVSIDGSLLRVDSIPEAREFVAGSRRLRAGVSLQTDIYGFYTGFGTFEAIRHKVTPSVSWSYAPEVLPTELQSRVFGPSFSRTQNSFTIGFNQTWEAKVTAVEVEAEAADSLEVAVSDTTAVELLPAADSAQAIGGFPGAEVPLVVDPEEALELDPQAVRVQLGSDEELGRPPPSQNVVLLGLQTNAITYDLVEADSTGNFIDGFRTLTLTNRVVSDYLRGLNLSFAHDLFDDSARLEGGPRKFSPHLSQMAFGFSLDDESGLFRALGSLLGMETDPEPEPEPQPEPEVVEPALQVVPDSPLDQFTGFDSDRVIPGDDPFDTRAPPEGWQADISYSLNRPRSADRGSRLRAQMIQSRVSFAPSPNWTVDWSTSYEVEARRFNDHVVNLRRDLHEWEARFGFVQTARGNWSFQFEVVLRANQDLRFDYRQRSLDANRARF